MFPLAWAFLLAMAGYLYFSLLLCSCSGYNYILAINIELREIYMEVLEGMLIH